MGFGLKAKKYDVKVNSADDNDFIIEATKNITLAIYPAYYPLMSLTRNLSMVVENGKKTGTRMFQKLITDQ
jgi:hypothetical protein